MAEPRTAMLFAPPQPPVQLPDDATVILGRSRDCEVRLPDADTSRRHAKIVGGGGRFVIHDLASTNGTFVNDERVEERELAPGDRIRIGDNTVTFCQVGAALDPPGDSEVQTVLLARPPTSDAFRGNLAEIPPFAVLQILEMGRKTGVLQLDSDGAAGELWLARGEPVHAQTAGQVGFDAAIALVHASKGSFAFEPRLETPAPTIECTVTQLLLEASRQLDEGML